MGLSAIWKKKLHGNRPVIAQGEVFVVSAFFFFLIALKPMWLLINHTTLCAVKPCYFLQCAIWKKIARFHYQSFIRYTK